jgi:alkylation response protein AidB-like acyl-CoA dehydrogenase
VAWEEQGFVPREVLRRMGQAGLFGLMYEGRFGGGDADALTNLVFAEALSASPRSPASSSPCWCTPIWPARTCTMPAMSVQKEKPT